MPEPILKEPLILRVAVIAGAAASRTADRSPAILMPEGEGVD